VEVDSLIESELAPILLADSLFVEAPKPENKLWLVSLASGHKYSRWFYSPTLSDSLGKLLYHSTGYRDEVTLGGSLLHKAAEIASRLGDTVVINRTLASWSFELEKERLGVTGPTFGDVAKTFIHTIGFMAQSRLYDGDNCPLD
jgi:hypothetical protein